MWVTTEDKNNKFFHNQVNIKQQKNNIWSTKSGSPEILYSQDDIIGELLKHFSNLYGSRE